jgi:hypothetical protein
MERLCVSAAKRGFPRQLTHTSMIACCRKNCAPAGRSRSKASTQGGGATVSKGYLFAEIESTDRADLLSNTSDVPRTTAVSRTGRQ